MEPQLKKPSTVSWQVAYAENIARRHMDVKKKAAFGLAWLEHERELAGDRKKATQAKPGQKVGSGNVAGTFEEQGDTRDIIGERWRKRQVVR